MIKEKAWEEFILSYPSKYSSPEHFRKACFKTAGGRE